MSQAKGLKQLKKPSGSHFAFRARSLASRFLSPYIFSGFSSPLAKFTYLLERKYLVSYNDILISCILRKSAGNALKTALADKTYIGCGPCGLTEYFLIVSCHARPNATAAELREGLEYIGLQMLICIVSILKISPHTPSSLGAHSPFPKQERKGERTHHQKFTPLLHENTELSSSCSLTLCQL